jgi:hypothetical protein
MVAGIEWTNSTTREAAYCRDKEKFPDLYLLSAFIIPASHCPGMSVYAYILQGPVLCNMEQTRVGEQMDKQQGY